ARVTNACVEHAARVIQTNLVRKRQRAACDAMALAPITRDERHVWRYTDEALRAWLHANFAKSRHLFDELRPPNPARRALQPIRARRRAHAHERECQSRSDPRCEGSPHLKAEMIAIH